MAMSNRTPPTVHHTPARRPPFPLETAQARSTTAYVRGFIESLVLRQPVRGILPPAVASARLMGARLTLHRAGETRRAVTRYASPRQLEWDHSLGYLLGYLASSMASSSSPGEPALTAAELPTMGLTLTLLYDAQLIGQTGEGRLGEVDPSTQGLLIEHPEGQAILLPDPGADWPVDPPRFLAQACQRAGLPPDAWRRDDRTLLTTFHTQEIVYEPEVSELSWLSLNGLRINTLVHVAQQAAALDAPLHARRTGDALLDDIQPAMLAVRVTTRQGASSWSAGKANSLAALAHAAGAGLRSQPAAEDGHIIDELTVYMQAVMLHAVRDEHLSGQTFLVEARGQPLLVTDAPDAGAALLKAGATWTQWHQGQVTLWQLTGRSQAVRQRKRPG